MLSKETDRQTLSDGQTKHKNKTLSLRTQNRSEELRRPETCSKHSSQHGTKMDLFI